MFVNKDRRLRPDAECIIDRAAHFTDADVARLEERQQILRDAINSLNARLLDVPERERKAIQCLFL